MKNTILVILFIALATPLQAQRRLHGQQGLQATVGKADGLRNNSLNVGGAFSQFTKNGHQWKFGAEYLCKKIQYGAQSLPIEQFTADGGYYRTLLSDGGKNFFFTAGISAMAGYELVNRDVPLLYNGATIVSKSKFLFGGAISFEIETYIIDQIILLTGFRQRILPSSTVNSFRSQFYLGIKFIIN
jgi:hypothetical protein